MSISGFPSVFGIHSYETGTTQLHPLGTLGFTPDGRVYRYAQAAGTALTAGQLQVAADITANHEDIAVNTAAVGDKTVTVTLGATAITANEYDEGTLHVVDETGQGTVYTIVSAPAADASASPIIEISPRIHVAFAAATTVTLVRNLYRDIVVGKTDQLDIPVGVPNVAFAANAYGWVQTRGYCPVLQDEAVTAGNVVTIGTGAGGAVEAHDAAGEQHVGIAPAGANTVDGEYNQIYLTID